MRSHFSHHRKTKTIRSRKKIIGAKKGKKPKQRRCFFVDCEDASVVLGGAALRCVPLVGRVKVPFDWLGRIVRGRISCSNWTISSSWTKWLGCRLQDRAVGRNRCPSWRCRPAPTCHPASIGWSSAHRCHPIELKSQLLWMENGTKFLPGSNWFPFLTNRVNR